MATRAALIREADLRRMARVVRKEGVDVRVDIAADGTVSVHMGQAAAAGTARPNGFDDAL